MIKDVVAIDGECTGSFMIRVAARVRFMLLMCFNNAQSGPRITDE